jgi:hypothetical protein
MSSPRLLALTLGLWACAALAPPASAKPNLTASRATAAQAITDCRKVADREARLDCYDKAADAFEQAQAAGQVVVVDRESIREVKRQAFGINVPSLNLFKTGPKDETLDRITVSLSGASQGVRNEWIMTTVDGAVWRQIDENELFNPPHAGSSMAIRRGLLGSFFCKVDGQQAIRCTRSQ